MVNISHATLTTTEVHEPKGAATATLGSVYVANGNGSGAWTAIGTSNFTGMIADFTWPVVVSGWLECNGADISTTTYSALYSVMTIQRTGTRSSSSSSITSLSSTTDIAVGYYAFGVGIPAGTTVITVNSGTQVTLSANAGSSGSANVIFSPWYLDNGTIRLPNLSTAGRFRRSRTASTAVGQLQDSQNLAHTHTGTGTTGNQSVDHTHGVSGTTGSENASHTHGMTTNFSFQGAAAGGAAAFLSNFGGSANIGSTGGQSPNHQHSFSTTSGVQSASHTHGITLTTDSTGSSEARPSNIVVMTCVKT